MSVITRVQGTKGNNVGNVSSLAKAFVGAVTAGNTLLAIVGTPQNPTNTFSMSDSVNGSWPAADISNAGVGQNAVAVFRLQSTGAGTPTVTATMTGTAAPMFLTIIEMSGLAASPLDQTASAVTGAGIAPAAGPTASTAQANELWLGVCMLNSNASVTLTAAGSWTLDETNDNFLGTEYQIVSAISTVSSSFSQASGAASAENFVVTYKGATAGGGGGTSHFGSLMGVGS